MYNLCSIIYSTQKGVLVRVQELFYSLFSPSAGASVVRGYNGFIVLFAKQSAGCPAGRVLVFTAVLMYLQNPLVLVWDAGFQLSFVATLGLVYFAPIGKAPALDANKIWSA